MSIDSTRHRARRSLRWSSPSLLSQTVRVARTSREGDRDDQPVRAGRSITLRNGACPIPDRRQQTTRVPPERTRHHQHHGGPHNPEPADPHWQIWRGRDSTTGRCRKAKNHCIRGRRGKPLARDEVAGSSGRGDASDTTRDDDGRGPFVGGRAAQRQRYRAARPGERESSCRLSSTSRVPSFRV